MVVDGKNDKNGLKTVQKNDPQPWKEDNLLDSMARATAGRER